MKKYKGLRVQVHKHAFLERKIQGLNMKCLIIADGPENRLSTLGNSKPLIPVVGLSIIERVILTAKEAGLTAFYVVTGYNGEEVRPFLGRFSLS